MDQNDKNIRTIQDVLQPARMSRKSFLKMSLGTAAAVGFGVTGTGCDVQARGRNLILANLDEALAELDLIEANPPVEMQQEWTLYKVLNHLAQSAEYSMTGYPEMYSSLVQSISKILFNNYKNAGFMNHNLTDPVPGAPEIPDTGDLPSAFQRLRNAIWDFQNYTGALFPHFAYGDLSYEDWELAHTFHIADHFSSLTYTIASE